MLASTVSPSALGGSVMELAAQNHYMPLEIMMDRAKRSYVIHSSTSLWGYHSTQAWGESGCASGTCGPPQMPVLTHDKGVDR